jgi:hypothetical protein
VSRVLGVVLAVLTVPLTLATTLTGVVYLDGVKVERHLSRTVPVDSARALTVFVNTDMASVTVVAGSAGQVVVDQDLNARGLTRGLAEQAVALLTSSVAGDARAVSVRPSGPFCCWSSLWVTEVSATVIVRLPPGANLSVETGSGDVSVSGVSGPGSVRARTQTGSVRISGTEPGGNIDVQTSNGGIVLDLAADASGRLDAASRTGTVSVDRAWPVAASDRHASGTLGQGGPSILLRSDQGDITVGVR